VGCAPLALVNVEVLLTAFSSITLRTGDRVGDLTKTAGEGACLDRSVPRGANSARPTAAHRSFARCCSRDGTGVVNDMLIARPMGEPMRCSQCGSENPDAKKFLPEIYNWFTDGFDTPDLKDARALLDELST
jgi:hypothetical protein